MLSKPLNALRATSQPTVDYIADYGAFVRCNPSARALGRLQSQCESHCQSEGKVAVGFLAPNPEGRGCIWFCNCVDAEAPIDEVAQGADL